jgi:hypothetical protein
LKAKQVLGVDHFGGAAGVPVKQKLAEVARIVEAELDDPTLDPAVDQGYLEQQMLSGYVSQLLQRKFAKGFAGKTEEEIDAILQSHRLSNCVTREPLLGYLKERFRD